jgi:hypothetical protein
MKEYIKPNISLMSADLSGMVMQSLPISSDTEVSGDEMLGKGIDIWEFEEEEDY